MPVPPGSSANLSDPLDRHNCHFDAGDHNNPIAQKDGRPRYLTRTDRHLHWLTDCASQSLKQSALCGMGRDFVAELSSSGMGLPSRVHCLKVRQESVDPIVHDLYLAAAAADKQEPLRLSTELHSRDYMYLLTSNAI